MSVSKEIDELEKSFFPFFKSIKKKYDAHIVLLIPPNSRNDNVQDDVSKIIDLLWGHLLSFMKW